MAQNRNMGRRRQGNSIPHKTSTSIENLEEMNAQMLTPVER
jgi:hypothetical protein